MDGKRGFEDTALFSPMSWLRNRGREKKINFRLNQGAQSSPKRLRCSLQSSERALSSLGWKLLFPSSIGVSEHEEDRSAGDLCHPQNSESGCAWKSAAFWNISGAGCIWYRSRSEKKGWSSQPHSETFFSSLPFFVVTFFSRAVNCSRDSRQLYCSLSKSSLITEDV